MFPLRQNSESSQDARVVPLKHPPELPGALRSMLSAKKPPSPDFSSAISLVARAAEVMEKAELHARTVKAEAVKYCQEMQSELADARADSENLKTRVATMELEQKNLEYQAREADLRARDLETKLGALRQQLSGTEQELDNAKAWLTCFETEISGRLVNASRALEELGATSFPATSGLNTAKRAAKHETN